MRPSFLVFILSLIFTPISWAQTLPPVDTYGELLTAIRQVRAASQARLEQAAEEEKVREAWETGRLIDLHILKQKRAEYGKQVLTRLAKDLHVSRTELSYMLEFARAYPIFRPAGKLSWAHYQSLLALNDPDERKILAEKAEKENWGRNQVREEVRKIKAQKSGEAAPPPAILTAVPGKLHTYRVVRHPASGEEVVDLGFSNFLETKTPFDQSSSESDRYTYEAKLIKVIDGDTLIASVDLGFGLSTVQTLRLRGLDAREVESRQGKEAKEFLEHELAQGPLVIRTVRSDKYDRYLVDLWVNGVYLNQKLVDEGFAVIVES